MTFIDGSGKGTPYVLLPELFVRIQIAQEGGSVPQNYWVDDLNPWVWQIKGNFGIRWYGLSYVIALIVTYAFFLRWSNKKVLPLTKDQVVTLLSSGAMAGIVGGRLSEFVLYRWAELQETPSHFINLSIPGMSIHGAFLFVALVVVYFARRWRVDKWLLLDACAVTTPLGIACGRIGNFVNGELWGRPSKVPWAVIFPHAPLIQGVQVPRHPSQLYAALLEGLMLAAITGWIYRQEKYSGLAAATGCLGYGIARFADEFWRAPDPSQPIYWGWMTRGQWLTLPMLIGGLFLLILRFRSSHIDLMNLRQRRQRRPGHT
jgi:phosphatidylglycerol:prolipoprotein diacylglycerol transferase